MRRAPARWPHNPKMAARMFVSTYPLVPNDAQGLQLLATLDQLRGYLVERVERGGGRLPPQEATVCMRYLCGLLYVAGGLRSAAAASPVLLMVAEVFAVPRLRLFPDQKEFQSDAFFTNQVRVELYVWAALAALAVAAGDPAAEERLANVRTCAALVRAARRLVFDGWSDATQLPARAAFLGTRVLFDRLEMALGAALEVSVMQRKRLAAAAAADDQASLRVHCAKHLPLLRDLYAWRDRLPTEVALALRSEYLRTYVGSGALVTLTRSDGMAAVRLEEWIFRCAFGEQRDDLLRQLTGPYTPYGAQPEPPVLTRVIFPPRAPDSALFSSLLDRVALPPLDADFRLGLRSQPPPAAARPPAGPGAAPGAGAAD